MNETLNSLCWNDRLDFVKQLDKFKFMEETIMDKKTQKIGVICSIVQIILSIICLMYNAINQENIIIWVLFLCSGILLLSSNISRNNKKEDEWGSANSSLQNWPKRARRSSFSFFIIVSLWYNRDIKIGSYGGEKCISQTKKTILCEW